MYRIPYLLVDRLPFVARQEQVRRHYGQPLRRERLEIGLQTLDYGSWVARFQASGQLEEVTKRAPALFLLRQRVLFADLDRFVRQHDAGFFVRGGFVVSPRFGLAFVPDEPDWVTALAAHCIPAWRAMPAG